MALPHEGMHEAHVMRQNINRINLEESEVLVDLDSSKFMMDDEFNHPEEEDDDVTSTITLTSTVYVTLSRPALTHTLEQPQEELANL